MTPRQRNVLDYIETHWEKHDYGPSYRDIAQRMEMSLSAAYNIVANLRGMGALHVRQGKARAIYPVEVHKKLFIAPDTDAKRMREALVEIRDIASVSEGVEFYVMIAERGLGKG
jgi:SOS-response transcriptional repressor LexA